MFLILWIAQHSRRFVAPQERVVDNEPFRVAPQLNGRNVRVWQVLVEIQIYAFPVNQNMLIVRKYVQ